MNKRAIWLFEVVFALAPALVAFILDKNLLQLLGSIEFLIFPFILTLTTIIEILSSPQFDLKDTKYSGTVLGLFFALIILIILMFSFKQVDGEEIRGLAALTIAIATVMSGTLIRKNISWNQKK